MATFSDFYQKALADLPKQQQGASAAPAAKPDLSGLPLAGKHSGDQPDSFLNWAVDIISRPLFAATNTIQGGVNSAVSAEMKGRQGDTLGQIGDAAGAVLGSPIRFLEGLFSNDREVKRTYSDVMEQTTDAIGSLDPRYVDEENNVNPVLKGSVGLALDIAADPLTWVPGGIVLKGVKYGAQGVSKGAEAVAGAVKNAREVKAPTEVVAETAAKSTDEVTPVPEGNPFEAQAKGPGATIPETTPAPPAAAPEAPVSPALQAAQEAEKVNPWDVLGPKGAQAYNDMPHNPADPAVKKSYDALARSVMKQYEEMKQAGIKIEIVSPKKGEADIYKNSAEMMKDVTENGRLRVLKTADDSLAPDHPMNRTVTVNGEKVLLNDLFRAVHDYMGHAKSADRGAHVSFGPRGEWEAWRTHRLTLPRESWGALWSETRGQNNWTNYWGNHAELPQAQRPFGEQKAGLVPEELWAADLIDGEDGRRILRELYNDSPNLPRMQEALKDLLSGKAVSSKVLTKAQWAKDPANAGKKLYANGGKEENNFSGKTIAQLRQIATSPDFPQEIRNRAIALLDKGYEKYASAAKQLPTDVQDALAAFRVKVATDEVLMDGLLGPELVRTLMRKRSPERFQDTVKVVLKALDPESSLPVFYKNHPQLAAAVENGLGIPKSSIKTEANTVEEVAAIEAKLSGGTPSSDAVRDAMAATLDGEVTNFRKRYPYVGKNGVAYTEKDPKVRLGRHFRHINTFFQYTLYRNLNKEVSDRILAKTGKESLDQVYGKQRALLYKETIESLSRDVADAVQAFGTKLNIGVKDELLPIAFPDVYRLVGEGFENADTALLALHNGGTRVAFTTLMQAVHLAAGAGDLSKLSRPDLITLRDTLIDVIQNPKKYGVRGGLNGPAANLPNNISGVGKGFVYAPNQKKAAQSAASAVGGKVTKTSGGAWQVSIPAGKLVEPLVDAILKSQRSVTELVASNSAAWAARGLDESSKLSNKEIKRIQALIESGAYKSAIVEDVTSIPKTIADEATEIGAAQTSVDAATEVATGAVGDATVKTAKAMKKVKTDVQSGGALQTAVEKGTQKRIDDAVDDMEFDGPQKPPGEGVKPEPDPTEWTGDVRDISLMDPADVYRHVLGGLLDPLRMAFNQNWGRGLVESIQNSASSVAQVFIKNKTAQISKLNKDYDGETLQAAFKALQDGTAPAHLSEPMKAVDDIFKTIIGTSKESSLLDHFFLSTENVLDHVNDIFRVKGLGMELDRKAAIETAKKTYGVKKPTEEQVAEALANQWREVSVKDVPDFLQRLSDAAATAAEHRAFVGYFQKHFTDLGMISLEPKAGMTKVVASGPSTFRSLLPKDIYMDATLAGQLHVADYLVRANRQLSGELGTAIRKYYLPVQNSWKRLITVMRPGHHIRNGIGNSSIAFVARGARFYGQSYKNALKVAGWRNDYGDLDVIASLNRIGEGLDTLPTGGDVLVTGRFGDMTAKEIEAAMYDYGLKTSYVSAEGLYQDALIQGRVQRAASKVSLEGTKVGDAASDISQFVTDIGRTQHFLQILMQESSKRGGQWSVKSKEELFRKAADEVRRAQPDATMLTPFESKYMRVLIPFYSWFGKVLPFAMESLLRNPGRVAVFPKASYELAVANGVNPDSLIDPFPEGQLFPSFLTEGVYGPQFVGPDGQYVNVNPGIAHIDVFREIGADPVRGVLGMTSPIIRMPAELASGGTWGSGSRINDTSDYLDQNIPIINYLSNVTGVSLTGSVPSVLSGQGLDPQLQVERGNKGGYEQGLTALNWLLGMNAQNWSRPNFVNYAEIEKRNRATEGQ